MSCACAAATNPPASNARTVRCKAFIACLLVDRERGSASARSRRAIESALPLVLWTARILRPSTEPVNAWRKPPRVAASLSIGADPRRADHLDPPRDVLAQDLAELLRRAADRVGALLGEALLHVGRARRFPDRIRHRFHDLARRAHGREHAVPHPHRRAG